MAAHFQSSQALASGIHAVADAESSFSVTLAAHRFLNNPRVSLSALAKPLLDAGRHEAGTACDRYLLVAHDWSQLMYPQHTSKADRVMPSSKHAPEGYELQTALLLSDRDGVPLAPGVLSLRAADGVHCSRSWKVRAPLSPLDELEPTMAYLESQELGRPLVHIIDAEADSVGHFRQWSETAGRYFLVRADDRLVQHDDVEQRCSTIHQQHREREAFQCVRSLSYHGKPAQQWIAEAAVVLTRPAQRNRPGVKDRRRIPGTPLPLRLVMAEVRDDDGRVLAVWYLLTNLPADADAAVIALWYYWRWSIETYFKLLKSAGLQLENWQQETAGAIARRLLIASMACVSVWRLAHHTTPAAAQARQLLIRLSGRQMKHRRPFTLPALLAGMQVLLAMLSVLQDYSADELRGLAQIAWPSARPPP